MGKFLRMLLVFAISLSFATGASAYNSNLSVDWIAMPSKNATVDGPEAALYNPAGLTKINDGLYLSTGNQFVLKEYSFELLGQENKDNDPSLLFPYAYAVYKQNGWAMFFSFTVPDGGGRVTYKNVLATTVPADIYADIEGDNAWLAFTLGGSFALNDMISFSSGLKYFNGSDSKKITVLNVMPGTYKTEWKSNGMAGFIGANVTPIKDLNIGIQFQPEAILIKKIETKDPVDYSGTFGPAGLNQLVIPADGKSTEYGTMPAILSLGIGYTMTPELLLQASGNITFLGERKWGGENYVPGQDFRGNSWEAGVAAQYTVMPVLKVSGGVNYSNSSKNKRSNSGLLEAVSPGLNSVGVGLGASIAAMQNLEVKIGGLRVIYAEGEDETGNKLNKSIWDFAFGVTYKAL